jgi:hypothetical protein
MKIKNAMKIDFRFILQSLLDRITIDDMDLDIIIYLILSAFIAIYYRTITFDIAKVQKK